MYSAALETLLRSEEARCVLRNTERLTGLIDTAVRDILGTAARTAAEYVFA